MQQNTRNRIGKGLGIAGASLLVATGINLLANSLSNVEGDGYQPANGVVSRVLRMDRFLECDRGDDGWECLPIPVVRPVGSGEPVNQYGAYQSGYYKGYKPMTDAEPTFASAATDLGYTTPRGALAGAFGPFTELLAGLAFMYAADRFQRQKKL